MKSNHCIMYGPLYYRPCSDSKWFQNPIQNFFFVFQDKEMECFPNLCYIFVLENTFPLLKNRFLFKNNFFYFSSFLL